MLFFVSRSISLSLRLLCSSKPHLSLQMPNFRRMNPVRKTDGWASQSHNSPSSSNRGSSNPHDHDRSSMYANAKEGTSIKNAAKTEAPIIDFSDEQIFPSLSSSVSKGISRRSGKSHYASTSPETTMGQENRLSIASSPFQSEGTVQPAHSSTNYSIGRPLHGRNSSDRLMDRNSSEHNKELPVVDSSPQRDGGPLPTAHSGSKDGLYKSGRPHPRQVSPKREDSHCSSISTDRHSPITPFDICPVKRRSIVLKAPLHVRNKEKRMELECSMYNSRHEILRPGMVLLKNYISLADQIKIVKICHDFGLDRGGFYQPGYDDGAKLRLHMMCLGLNWDPQTRLYSNSRSIDDATPPSIPDEFKELVAKAIEASHAAIKQESSVKNPEKVVPSMTPDICIVNFYTRSGKLGLHQDRDESQESIEKGLPVVSFSIGDSAVFLYGDDRDADKAMKVELKSGDVLIFGGASRRVFHGVPLIIPDSAPKFLVDEANLRPGRLNLTFRQY